MGKYFIAILMLFTVLVGCSNVENTSQITLNEYNQLEEGMTYEKVVEIIGSEGDKGTVDTKEEDKVEKFVWKGTEDESMAEISFLDGKLRGKWENNLK
ncbi:hypothetical protein [Sutcliffiella horikoshii]|uniref:hypothetical protein n=1 Tax=Sutcliffiella horikoshii TaxID=79883 RepID=UPI001CFD2789|nr:hypothetical protein [Sutcliffiella horikoshii]